MIHIEHYVYFTGIDMSKLISRFDAIRFPLIPKKFYLKHQAKRASRKYEQELELLRFLVPEGSNAIDGGAHKGIYSYYLSFLCKNVYAFEPNPTMFNYLKAAVPGNVTCYQAALSETSGNAEFNIPVSPGRFHHTQGSLLNVEGAEGSVKINVDIQRIDDLNLTNIGFIKLDIEGNELSALKGAVNLLQSCRPVILAEATKVGDTSVSELVNFLTERNYIPVVCNDGKLMYFGDKTDDNITHNCIFIPNKA
jgi:FkbM family methyltransferase